MTRKIDRSIAALERVIKDAKARLGNSAPGPKLRRAVEALGKALAAWPIPSPPDGGAFSSDASCMPGVASEG
jgi:hypothetical protein